MCLRGYVKSVLYVTLLTIVGVAPQLHGEEVGKFVWKGDLIGLDGKTLETPEKTVAMSEYVHVQTSIDNVTEKDPCSIQFIIDNSSSNSENDPTGQRYEVVNSLIDYIYETAPDTKIGLTIFGSRLWFYGPDNTNPKVFLSNPNDQYHGGNGCVIPPLNLDEEYSGTMNGFDEGSFGYTMTGYDLLKMYLETKDDFFIGKSSAYTPTHTVPDWNQTTHKSSLTNITRAFDGANQAHLAMDPLLKKNRHFNIFFSDGIAGVDVKNPDKPYEQDYIQGRNTPTTFTFYYHPDGNPRDLPTMTNNIKNNGYSPNNELSQLWAMSNWITIKQILKEDVFDKILSESKGTPTKIVIEGSTSSDWDSKGFKYDDMFPLEIGETPFSLDLEVHIVKDSLDQDGNIIKHEEFDTTLHSDFKVTSGPGTDIPDSMEIIKWGRTLAWGENGTPLTSIGSDVTSIPLNFESYKVDTILDYDTVDVEIRTADNSDVETIRLTKSGNIWSGTIDREVGSGSKGDGVLQHLEVDEFIAVFRNGYLPLDTMEVRLTYTDAMVWELGDAAYFDNSADGLIDSLFVEIVGDRWEKNLDAIADVIDLPAGRDLDKEEFAVDGSGIGFTLKQNDATKNTAVSSSDAIEVADDLDLPNSSLLLKATVTPQDKMAPVALSALFSDSVATASEDYLAVTYSEAVTNVDDEDVHLFKSGASNSYDVTLQNPQTAGAVVTYLVTSVTGVSNISDGDSLKINSGLSTSIGDAEGNGQDNSDNIWAPITVETIEEGIKLRRAAYFDEDADGYPDLIRVWSDGEPVTGIVDEIVSNINFASERDFSVLSSSASGEHEFEINVSSGAAASINTAISNNETLVVSNKIELPGGAFLLSTNVVPEDSMAPVAVSALFEDSITAGSTDYLTVDFSEEIEDGYGQINPLLFKSSGDVNFNCDLANGIKNSEQIVWELTSISGHDRIRTGDTLWINDGVSGSMSDAFSNDQSNALNRRCPINVEIATGKVQISEALWLDGNADGRVDTVRLTFDMDLEPGWIAEIENAILFEGYRKLGIDGSSHLDGNVLSIPVEETTTDAINTALQSDEAIRLSEQLLLSPDWALSAGTVNAADGMAPVALSAELVDSIALGTTDYLTTVFSENIINGYTDKNALKFISDDGTEYMCDLEDAQLDGNQIVWKVTAVDGVDRVQTGDSLWINDEISSPIGDGDNSQSNPLNLRCPINVIIAAGEVVAEEALWLDGNGDGRTDTVMVTFNMNLKSEWISIIEDGLHFNGDRELSLDGESRRDGNYLFIPVEENMSGDPRTYILNDEALVWSDQLILDNDWALNAATLDAVDGMAPVIISATCTDTLRHFIKGKTSSDEVIDVQDLEVVFSEDVSEEMEKRALTFIRNSSDFHIDLSFSSLDMETVYWKTESNDELLTEGDSAKINSSVSNAMSDLLDNKQEIENNRTVLIDFIHHKDTVIEVVPYTLIPQNIHLNKYEELSDEVLQAIPGLEDAMKESDESLSEMKLALLGLQPDELENVSPFDKFEAEVAIFDVVGNCVYGPHPMVVKENGNGPEGLYRLWNGKNKLNRFVGTGSFLVMYSIKITHYGGKIEQYEKRSMVSVQGK